MDEQQALTNRMEFFEFKEYPELEKMSGHLNPLSWLYLMEQMEMSDGRTAGVNKSYGILRI